MSGYTKLFASILESTIWLEPPPTKVVWITLLAMADRDGIVEASLPGLAKRAGVERTQCEQALSVFLAPDPDSRTTAYDGRRIVPVPGGWRLLNYELHRQRASKEEAAEKNAARQRRYREAKALRAVTSVTSVTSNDIAPASPPAPSDSEQKTSSADADGARVVTPKRRKAQNDGPSAFDGFWGDYPRKVGKVAARKVWEVLDPPQVIVNQIAEALVWQKVQPQWTKDSGQFIPHPATWLRQKRWQDEPAARPSAKL